MILMQPVGGGTLVCEESTLGAIPIMVCNSDRRYVCPKVLLKREEMGLSMTLSLTVV